MGNYDEQREKYANPSEPDDITVGSIWDGKCGEGEVKVNFFNHHYVNYSYLTDEDGDFDMKHDDFRFYFSPISPKPVGASANAILATASYMLGERGKQYDTNGEERSMAKIVASFNAKTGRDLTELEGWLFMTDLKAVRALAGGSMDCFVDGAAYFALAGESIGTGE